MTCYLLQRCDEETFSRQEVDGLHLNCEAIVPASTQQNSVCYTLAQCNSKHETCG